jgi:hypothetical protein
VDVRRLAELLRRGDTIHQMMQVTGEEGVYRRQIDELLGGSAAAPTAAAAASSA